MFFLPVFRRAIRAAHMAASESGTRPLSREFVRGAAKLARQYGALLIFDEVVTAVPDPNIRNISTEGTMSEIFFASLYSNSWNRPVEGPQVFRSSTTCGGSDYVL